MQTLNKAQASHEQTCLAAVYKALAADTAGKGQTHPSHLEQVLELLSEEDKQVIVLRMYNTVQEIRQHGRYSRTKRRG